MSEPQRYLLGIAYQAGRDPRIAKGADGSRDYFTAEELEKAAWTFAKSAQEVGLFHMDGTEGHAEVVESYIYRGNPWVVDETPGHEVIVRKGDWLIGVILDETAWEMYEKGEITGFSPQGSAKRRRKVAE